MMNINPTGEPMMSAIEVDIIHNLLNAKPQARVLEWGAGNSTLVFPVQHDVIKWTAIEHDAEYAEYIVKHASRDNIEVLFQPLIPDYINCVNGNKYDFILIDGIEREKCLDKAMELAKPDAYVLLHDAGRQEYQPFINKYPHLKLCDGEIPTENGFFAHRGLVRFFV